MESFIRGLKTLLPENQHYLLTEDFIPWEAVLKSHAGSWPAALKALFGSYDLLNRRLDLKSLVRREIPASSWGCRRCGHCCTSMRPGPVSADTYHRWRESDLPVAWFYSARESKTPSPTYRCWYHGGVRLRVCPFMFINLQDFKPFCSLYHMGDHSRPSMCSGFVPRHQDCGSSITADPWECQ